MKQTQFCVTSARFDKINSRDLKDCKGCAYLFTVLTQRSRAVLLVTFLKSANEPSLLPKHIFLPRWDK